ncbi:MAG TPA: twin-arginine translocation signal domain-containing protein [Vicinamibacterales bacterium]|nr:twin-arginine translocation signal domain-containing protein [Vicinamibacterales bacterium]
MERTTRRNLLKAAAMGGATATGLTAVFAAESNAAAQKPGQGSEHAHDNRPLTGKRANVLVTFGQWDVDPDAPFDRQPNVSTRTRNIHRLLPFEAEVDAGGAVSFAISGVHQIVIYADGTEFEDLKAAYLAAGSPVVPGPGVPPLIQYSEGRVYRGLDPRVLTYAPTTTPPTASHLNQDRIESVNFKEPGRYLVVCGVQPHFLEEMHGYVNVKA